MTAEYRESVVETRHVQFQKAIAIEKDWGALGTKEGVDSETLLELQYQLHRSTYLMLDQKPFETIEAYKADLAEKRAMIVQARADAATETH